MKPTHWDPYFDRLCQKLSVCLDISRRSQTGLPGDLWCMATLRPVFVRSARAGIASDLVEAIRQCVLQAQGSPPLAILDPKIHSWTPSPGLPMSSSDFLQPSTMQTASAFLPPAQVRQHDLTLTDDPNSASQYLPCSGTYAVLESGELLSALGVTCLTSLVEGENLSGEVNLNIRRSIDLGTQGVWRAELSSTSSMPRASAKCLMFHKGVTSTPNYGPPFRTIDNISTSAKVLTSQFSSPAPLLHVNSRADPFSVSLPFPSPPTNGLSPDFSCPTISIASVLSNSSAHDTTAGYLVSSIPTSLIDSPVSPTAQMTAKTTYPTEMSASIASCFQTNQLEKSMSVASKGLNYPGFSSITYNDPAFADSYSVQQATASNRQSDLFTTGPYQLSDQLTSRYFSPFVNSLSSELLSPAESVMPLLKKQTMHPLSSGLNAIGWTTIVPVGQTTPNYLANRFSKPTTLSDGKTIAFNNPKLTDMTRYLIHASSLGLTYSPLSYAQLTDPSITHVLPFPQTKLASSSVVVTASPTSLTTFTGVPNFAFPSGLGASISAYCPCIACQQMAADSARILVSMAVGLTPSASLPPNLTLISGQLAETHTLANQPSVHPGLPTNSGNLDGHNEDKSVCSASAVEERGTCKVSYLVVQAGAKTRFTCDVSPTLKDTNGRNKFDYNSRIKTSVI
ncbi:unnamed protein product [Protopolystoma xenopodis]|uniref:Uncharacterized protein n=1 Tax=Protopolystoma xenopodis TaxID=117903 RepID=A0A3S5AVC9_9PLAT|nr:unnamed protein product [Protopolystoma xenopodis]